MKIANHLTQDVLKIKTAILLKTGETIIQIDKTTDLHQSQTQKEVEENKFNNMIKKYYLLSFFLCLLSIIYSQNEVDALRYSLFDNYTTARASSLGGAFSSLGGNIGAVQANPAALGIYRTDEVSISLINTNESIKSNYYNSTNTIDRSALDLQNFGYVKSMAVDNDWNRINISISFNQKSDLNQALKIAGYNQYSSRTNEFAQNSNGLTIDDLNGFSDYLAYQTFLIDTLANETQYETANQIIGQNQTANILESGYINDVDISFSGAYKDFMFIGMSIGFSEIYFSQYNEYIEDGFDNTGSNYEWGNLQSFNYNQSLSVTGQGMNFKIGAILKPSYFIRLGWAYHSKTYNSIQETYETNLQTTFINQNDEERWTATSPTNYFEYQLNTPAKSIASIGVIIQKRGFLTFDYENVNYSSANLNSTMYQFNNENNNILNSYRKTQNIKMGVEIKIQNIGLRGGYAIFGSPFKDGLNDGAKEYVSGGIGFQKNQYFFDIAIIHSSSKEDYPLYGNIDNDNSSQTANLNTLNQSVIISCSYKF